jgi:hypothetical protein
MYTTLMQVMIIDNERGSSPVTIAWSLRCAAFNPLIDCQCGSVDHTNNANDDKNHIKNACVCGSRNGSVVEDRLISH